MAVRRFTESANTNPSIPLAADDPRLGLVNPNDKSPSPKRWPDRLRGLFLTDGCGAGKTIQAIVGSYAYALKTVEEYPTGPFSPILITYPSQVQDDWAREVRRTMGFKNRMTFFKWIPSHATNVSSIERGLTAITTDQILAAFLPNGEFDPNSLRTAFKVVMTSHRTLPLRASVAKQMYADIENEVRTQYESDYDAVSSDAAFLFGLEAGKFGRSGKLVCRGHPNFPLLRQFRCVLESSLWCSFSAESIDRSNIYKHSMQPCDWEREACSWHILAFSILHCRRPTAMVSNVITDAVEAILCPHNDGAYY